MGISVPGLLNFRGDRWQVAADLLRSSARGSTAQADSLRAAADAMSKAWSDEIGAMIAERCRQQADLVEQQATTLPPLADALDAGAAQMQDLSTEMLKLVERAAAADVVVTDDGGARPAFDLGLLDPREAAKRIAVANAVRAVATSILHRADLVDRRLATVLALALGLMAPPFDMGPLDLSDEALARAADLTTQGSTGYCAWVSPLMSLARSNPDFIRRHMVWDEDSQTYTVILYDRDTGAPIQVSVDPRQLPEFPSNGMTQEPDFVSIYTQAMRQTYPDIDSSNFQLTGKIVLGKTYDEHTSREVPFDEIRDTLDTEPPGSAMVATTGAPEQQPDDVPANKKLYGGHAYSVVGFTPDGQIILRNPHGPGSDSHTVTLTEDEYRRWINGVMTWPAQ